MRRMEMPVSERVEEDGDVAVAVGQRVMVEPHGRSMVRRAEPREICPSGPTWAWERRLQM